MRDSGDSPHPPGERAQGVAKAQETVELRVLPGPQAPWRRLWDWLLAPVSEPGTGTWGEGQPGTGASADEGGDRP